MLQLLAYHAHSPAVCMQASLPSNSPIGHPSRCTAFWAQQMHCFLGQAGFDCTTLGPQAFGSAQIGQIAFPVILGGAAHA
jgi:hypothetical protein